MKVAVIGAGSWGTALAQRLALNGHQVCIWARKESVVQGINQEHKNPRYLSDRELSPQVSASTDYAQVLADAQAVVVVTPSATARQTAQALQPFIGESLPVILCSKGVEAETGMVGVQVFAEVCGGEDRFAALSGPNHAEEVILDIPAATVIASSSAETAALFQQLFAAPNFRTYVSSDVLGVELCAAFKNVIAIASGVSYGLGYGDNTAAMLQTRGLAEMSRLVKACGGEEMTCLGLAGAGDLIVTCMSKHSRNRRLGEMLARGETLDDFVAQTHMVAEGAVACQSLYQLAQKMQVELPINAMVYALIWENVDIQTIISTLLERSLKPEFY